MVTIPQGIPGKTASMTSIPIIALFHGGLHLGAHGSAISYIHYRTYPGTHSPLLFPVPACTSPPPGIATFVLPPPLRNPPAPMPLTRTATSIAPAPPPQYESAPNLNHVMGAAIYIAPPRTRYQSVSAQPAKVAISVAPRLSRRQPVAAPPTGTATPVAPLPPASAHPIPTRRPPP